jgi:DNA-binding NarL/FixJ family response regulator
MSIRVLAADDHNIVRQAIVEIIDANPDLCVVAEAEDGEAMIRKYSKFRPDIVLTDISMPRLNGLEAVKLLLEKEPGAKVIFLSMFTNDEYIYKSLKVGAKGLIGKDILKGELAEAIKTVAAGGIYYPARSEKDLHEIVKRYDALSLEKPKSKIDLLNAREKKVLKLLSEGLSSEEIGIKLYISTKTVSKARSSIMEKLQIKSFHHLIRFAVEYFFDKQDDVI